ncbi:MAG: DNA polymerase III subunit beta [Candidatus Buchananbacteria bacterium]|nr:DNA polymerase III subunit beta [Candidatus Buchananbacteria bacterium]
MKITCTQENLNQGLNIVSHIASKNTSLPILNNVLIKAEKGILNLTTTNLEIGINCQIRGKIEKDGSYTVHSKLINDYVNLLPNQKVLLEQKDDNLEIKTEQQETKIKGNSPEEFPLIPQVTRSEVYSCKINEILKAFSQVLLAVSVSETRPEISGVYFNFKEDLLTLATTDSYRLAEKKIKLKEKVKTEKEVIIPAKTIQELFRILSNLTGQNERVSDEESNSGLEIYFEDNQVLFVFDNVELVSRIIEGQYPNYQQIIPSDYKTKAIVNINDLIKATKTAALFSRTGIYDINLELDKNGVTVSSTNNQLGENRSKVESIVTGEDNKIIINYRYLLDGLQNIDASQLIFEMSDESNPCVIKPAESLPEGEEPIASEDYLYIIMPIKQ